MGDLRLPVRRVDPEAATGPGATQAPAEWLLTNGLGGYALGALDGRLLRRYHGFLVAALPPPLGRAVMLSALDEHVVTGTGEVTVLSSPVGDAGPFQADVVLEGGMPVWHYRLPGGILERRVTMTHLQNTVHVLYRLLDGSGPLRLELRLGLAFRPHETEVGPLEGAYRVGSPDGADAAPGRYDCVGPSPFPLLHLQLWDEGTAFVAEEETWRDLRYPLEAARGYVARGDLWCPGVLSAELSRGASLTLTVSTEPWPILTALTPAQALDAERARRLGLLGRAAPAVRWGAPAELVLAADQFVIRPPGGDAAAPGATAGEQDARTVIAGYPWFTDWGRDTMIALEGLTLLTGRVEDARYLLDRFAGHARDGLIPHFFAEGEQDAVYHAADATLLLFHALDRYLAATGDRVFLEALLPWLVDAVRRYQQGTRYGIHVDAADGLLAQGAPTHPLTWMDAQEEGWIVTPRRGKAVEIVALWYNALRLLEGWLREVSGHAGTIPDRMRGDTGLDADEVGAAAERARQSFNRRFWYDQGGYLYDVVDGEDGDDSACRPNQLFALSLAHPVLDECRWGLVFDTVRRDLLTPVGLRSLAPWDPSYVPRYDGDRRARDAAYHQGTVWPWLLGPYVDAWMRVHPHQAEEARAFLDGMLERLGGSGIGTLSEVCDAEAPYTPRGCPAQAFSVAEALRSWARTA